MAKNQVVAVDIGTNTVKLVQLAQTPSGMQLVSAAVAHYPRANATQEIDAATVSQTLEQLWQKVQGRKSAVILSIPRLSVTTRRLTDFPSAATDEQLPGLVSMQAETEIPFSIENSIFDYHDVRRGDNGVSVELIAAKRGGVQKYINYLQPIGTVPMGIIPSVMATAALARLQLKAHASERITIIADIGAGHVDFCLMQGQSLKFSRSFPIGGNELTLRYQNKSGGGFEHAERQKISNATLVRETPDTLPTYEWAEQLVSQIDKSIAAAQREPQSGLPGQADEIWLCGGGARIPGLGEYVADRLRIPTNLWNPFDAFKDAGGQAEAPIESVQEFGDTLAVALGMGVNTVTHGITLDLLPKEEKAKLTQTEQRRRLISAIAAGIILIVGLGLGGLTWSKSQQAKMAALDEEIRRIKRAESNAQKALVKDLVIADLLTPRASALDILRELSLRFSDRTKVAWTTFNITHLDEVDKAKITFNVEAQSHEDVSEIIRVMDQSGIFTNIKSGDVSSVQRNEKPIFRTQVACNLSSDAVQMFAQSHHYGAERQTESQEKEQLAQQAEQSTAENGQSSRTEQDSSDEHPDTLVVDSSK